MKISSVMVAVAIAAFSAAFCSCDDDGGKYNPKAKVYINGVDAQNKAATAQQRLTVEQICKGDSVALAGSIGGGDIFSFVSATDHYIDTVNMRLVFPAYNIFGTDNSLDADNSSFFRENERYYLIDCHIASPHFQDTLGYIPIQSRLEAKETLRELFKDRDANREAIYKVFTEAFQFVPCTGAEYKAMIERGEE